MKRFLSAIICFTLVFSALAVTSCGKNGRQKTSTDTEITAYSGSQSGSETAQLSVYAPDGAPALAIAKFIADGDDFGTGAEVKYNVVAPSNIGDVAGKGDIVVVPVNAASKVFAAKSYKMAGVVTHGNLYVMAKTPLTAEELVGKVVGVTNLANVPGLTLRAALDAKGIGYEISDEPVAGKVALKDYDATELIPALKTGKAEIGVLPEPAASKLVSMNVGFSAVINLQELYDAEKRAYPQAVIMIRSSIIDLYPHLIENIAAKLDLGVAWVKENPAAAAGAIASALAEGVTQSINAGNLTPAIVDACNIFWQSASSAGSEVTDYLTKINAVQAGSAGAVTDEFFA